MRACELIPNGSGKPLRWVARQSSCDVHSILTARRSACNEKATILIQECPSVNAARRRTRSYRTSGPSVRPSYSFNFDRRAGFVRIGLAGGSRVQLFGGFAGGSVGAFTSLIGFFTSWRSFLRARERIGPIVFTGIFSSVLISS